ncbi:MAG: nucleotide exchange factor GrpE [Candidatus Sumerlaeaceae bacterium]|jgi:molecular chaperone GrpE
MKDTWVLEPILAREFVIDEKPVNLQMPDEVVSEKDLLSSVAETMKRLADLEFEKEELLRCQGKPEELEKFIRQLLPTLDAFDRVLAMARAYPKNDEIDNWLKAVESIYYRLLRLLESYGLQQLNTVGKKVDLNIHDVVEYRPSTEHPHDTVISERQKAYMFRGKLLRDAKVVVAYNERS